MLYVHSFCGNIFTHTIFSSNMLLKFVSLLFSLSPISTCLLSFFAQIRIYSNQNCYVFHIFSSFWKHLMGFKHVINMVSSPCASQNVDWMYWWQFSQFHKTFGVYLFLSILSCLTMTTVCKENMLLLETV